MKLALNLIISLFVFWHIAASPQSSPQGARELLALSETQNDTNHSLAIETAQQALALFTSANDLEGMAEAYNDLGRYHLAQNDLFEAAQFFDSSIQLWQQQNNRAEEAAVSIQRGYVESRKGEWLSAIDYFARAQNLMTQTGNPDPAQLARIESGLAYVFRESGLLQSALSHYEQALNYYRQTTEYGLVTRMTLLIGYTQFLSGNYAAAISSINEALAAYSKPENALARAECHEYLGQIYLAQGEYDQAREHLQLALPVYQSAGNSREAAQVIAFIGQIDEQEGAVARARSRYLEASTTFRRVSDRINDAAVRFALGRLELKNGNYEAAETYLKESIDDTENIRRDLTSRVFAAAFSASVHDRYAAYIDCLIHKHKSRPSEGFDVLALQASELARGRSLAELLRDTQTNVVAGVDPQLVQQEKMLRQSIRAKVDERISILAGPYRKEELDEVEGALARLREEHDRVSEKLRNVNPAFDRIFAPTAYSLPEIQSKVVDDNQTMLLEYFVGENASYLWAVTQKNVKLYELPPEAKITEAAARVYKLLEQQPAKDSENDLPRATNDLAKMVLAPVADQLNARQLIVVADGALNYIPFQLLPASSSNNQPLVETYEIINVPSASILGQLREEKLKRQAPAKVLAAFGDPAFAANYARLKGTSEADSAVIAKVNESDPRDSASRAIELSDNSVDPSLIQPLFYSRRELANLREIAGDNSLFATGFNASRKVFESTDLSQFSIVHLATHGQFSPKTPEQSGFYLSMVDPERRRQNGYMTLQDVYGLQAPVDLVVLSACRTALGKEVRGEGLIGLTRGFMHAGASSVAASLWEVDDEATAELMKHFYANMLQKGMTPAAALRAAQNTIRRDPQWQSPHFWAAFTLQGEYKQVIKAPVTNWSSSMFWRIGALAAVLLLLLVGIRIMLYKAS